MKKIYRLFLVLLLIIITNLLITGCQKEQKEDQKKDTEVALTDDEILSEDSYAIKVGEETVYYNEAMVYVLLLKQEYEPSLGEEIWDYDAGDGTRFADMAKQEVTDEIIQLKIISNKAKELGIELDEDEEEEALETATEHFNVISVEDKNKYGITLGTLNQVYRDNLLASKVFDIVTSDIDTEVSDAQARQITIYQILIKTTKQDLNGEIISLTPDQKQDALKETRKLLKKAKKEEDFKIFAKENTQADKVEYTFGKGDMNDAVEEAAFGLETGQLSGVIVSDEGYHIIYCANHFDENATADKKEDIILERQTKYFQDTYEKWQETYKVTINNKVWNQVTFTEVDEIEE